MSTLSMSATITVRRRIEQREILRIASAARFAADLAQRELALHRCHGSGSSKGPTVLEEPAALNI
jgi:hypothetical protein